MRVALTMRITEASGYKEPRDSISHDWIGRLSSWGITPVFVPNTLADPVSYFRDLAVDVLVLTGGDDLEATPARDTTEHALLEYTLNTKTPVFGVCRGMQLINHYFGGALTLLDGHIGTPHTVSFSTDWQSLYDNETHVNSFHAFGIKPDGLASELSGFAWDKDGHIEAFHDRDRPVIAVMWHPERGAPLKGDEIILRKLAREGAFWR